MKQRLVSTPPGSWLGEPALAPRAASAWLAATSAPNPRTSSERPMVSVVVPARDEESFLPACLDSILAQTYPAQRMEVIVVDNRSTDRTGAIARSRAARDARVRVVDCDGPNQAAAMNAGVLAARGEIVARVDAHGFLAPDYLDSLVAAFARHPRAVAVGGPYLPAATSFMARVVGAARASRLGVGGGWYSDGQLEDHVVRTVGCPAYRRPALLLAGPFDPALPFGEDDELNWRLLRAGGEIVCCPALRQHNHARGSLRGLVRQYWSYGRGRVRVLVKHPDYLLPRHLAPSLFVVALAACAAAAPLSPLGRLAGAVLVSTYAAALLLAAAGARRHGVRVAALVPLAAAAMHFAYGAGMLTEAARARLRPAWDARQASWATDPAAPAAARGKDPRWSIPWKT